MRATTCPPGIVGASADGILGLQQAALRGVTDYVTQAVNRPAGAGTVVLDVLSWYRTMTERRPP